MTSLFGPDGKVNKALEVIKNLMLLGVLALVCCLPIVTIGGSLTALSDVALKIARGEEGYVTKDFFRSFKRNFKPATVIWLVMLALIVFFSVDLYIMEHTSVEFPDFMKIVIVVALVVVLLVMTYIFPFIARFENTVKGYVKNGIMMTLLNLPRAILMLVLYALPSVIGGYFYEVAPLVLIFGLSLPAWLSAKMAYGKYFLGLEEKIEAMEKQKAGAQ